MTPESIVAAADAVLLAPPPRGWLDCGLAADLILTRAGFPAPMGVVAQTYDTPLQLFRRIRAHGGWHNHFAATVEGSGYRPGGQKTGAVGYVKNNERRFGGVAVVCAAPGFWIAPIDRGYTVLKEAEYSWCS
ncbi:hypothetical protein Q4525_14765 [Shimia thalassica]|uniref:hypothetical protein n=1 Tax=Shimia thalassica TaxID=1715693 RepID=UPI001C085400|nr:hypothetical protein [Shimia thalassica]MBU2941074.1 hypothetical protein [Shimia thalassica]MDO6504199.1 hypothetical protein [Shimia thalassica]